MRAKRAENFDYTSVRREVEKEAKLMYARGVSERCYFEGKRAS
jgi:hypothetical protein